MTNYRKDGASKKTLNMLGLPYLEVKGNKTKKFTFKVPLKSIGLKDTVINVDIITTSEKKAREMARKNLQFKRLPKGTKIVKVKKLNIGDIY